MSPAEFWAGPPAMTAKEVAALLQVSEEWCWRHREDLDGKKIGRRVRFPRSKIGERLGIPKPEPVRAETLRRPRGRVRSRRRKAA